MTPLYLRVHSKPTEERLPPFLLGMLALALMAVLVPGVVLLAIEIIG